MKKYLRWLRDILLTILILLLSFGLSLLLHRYYEVQEHVTSIFIFAVFLISFVTDGYIYGIVAAFLAMLSVNYAFTFPYFSLNFTLENNLISAGVMIILSLLTSAMTTKIKLHEAMKSESEKERMRANLLRAISHDLRTPLTTIYGSSTAILENEDSLTQEQKRKMLQGIREDSEWLVQMVENLLSITRLDAGKVSLKKTPTVLDELIDSVLLKFKKRYPEQVVHLRMPERIVVISMDALLIEQVILNLLDNAVQHAKGMSKLSLRVFLLGNRAIFEILDNGCGVNEEKLKHIFMGYSVTASERADSHKHNFGIGLPVCATIVRAHGGSIHAENVPHGGAVFRFVLETEDEDIEQ